jgi:hypothetical protein
MGRARPRPTALDDKDGPLDRMSRGNQIVPRSWQLGGQRPYPARSTKPIAESGGNSPREGGLGGFETLGLGAAGAGARSWGGRGALRTSRPGRITRALILSVGVLLQIIPARKWPARIAVDRSDVCMGAHVAARARSPNDPASVPDDDRRRAARPSRHLLCVSARLPDLMADGCRPPKADNHIPVWVSVSERAAPTRAQARQNRQPLCRASRTRTSLPPAMSRFVAPHVLRVPFSSRSST